MVTVTRTTYIMSIEAKRTIYAKEFGAYPELKVKMLPQLSEEFDEERPNNGRAHLIDLAFDWFETEEKYFFWDNIFRKFISNENVPNSEILEVMKSYNLL